MDFFYQDCQPRMKIQKRGIRHILSSIHFQLQLLFWGKKSKIIHLSFKGFHSYNTPKITSTHKSYHSVTDFLVLKSKDPLSECLRSSKHDEMHILLLCHSKINIHQLYEKTLLPIFFSTSSHSLGLFVFFSPFTLHRFFPNSFYSLVFNQQPFLMGIKRPSFPCHCKRRASTLFVLQSFSLSTFDIRTRKFFAVGVFLAKPGC